MPKTTQRVRVRLDITLHFPRSIDSLPIGGPADADSLVDAVGDALSKLLSSEDAKSVEMSCESSFGLDYRKPKKEVDHA